MAFSRTTKLPSYPGNRGSWNWSSRLSRGCLRLQVATHVVEMVPLKKAGERDESLKKELEGAREELVRMQGN